MLLFPNLLIAETMLKPHFYAANYDYLSKIIKFTAFSKEFISRNQSRKH